MKTLIRPLFVALALCSPSVAQELQNGDLLLTVRSQSDSKVRHFDPNGTEFQSTLGGTFGLFRGAANTASGLVVTAREGWVGVNFFDPVTGVEVATFDTGAVIGYILGGMSMLSDGTVAVADPNGRIHLYSDAGLNLLNYSHPVDVYNTRDLYVDDQDGLWVTEESTLFQDDGKIWHYDRFGNLLGSFVTNFSAGASVRAADGTLWVTDYQGNEVHHLTAAGVPLGSFATSVPVDTEFAGIGLAADGTLYVTSGKSPAIYHYDTSGVLLDQIAIGVPASDAWYVSLSVVKNTMDPVGYPFCFGDGTGATCPCGTTGPAGTGCVNSVGLGAVLSSYGEASITSDSFRLAVTDVPGAKPGLILRGINQTSGGSGLPVGDGLLCVAGQSARSQIQVTSAGGTTFTEFNGAPFGQSSYGAGVETKYQFWYRDTANPCTGSFNFSNSWAVTWLP